MWGTEQSIMPGYDTKREYETDHALIEAERDNNAVDAFAQAMKEKLAKARAKGRKGWNDKKTCSDEYLASNFFQCLKKYNDGNFIDLANFLMFLHVRGASSRILASDIASSVFPEILLEDGDKWNVTFTHGAPWNATADETVLVANEEEARKLQALYLKLKFESIPNPPFHPKGEPFEILGLTILETYTKLLQEKGLVFVALMEKAINQIKDLEHFSHYTAGLWCTDRPDLIAADIRDNEKICWKINFWEKSDAS